MEERTVALDFRCDESCNLPDMRGSPMIFVNVHVEGARKRHLLVATCMLDTSKGQIPDGTVKRADGSVISRY